jgi:DNA mismatch repair protein MSH4
MFKGRTVGLELARLADLPQDVLVEGKRVAKNLAALHARHEENSESSKIAMRRKALLRVCDFIGCPPAG